MVKFIKCMYPLLPVILFASLLYGAATNYGRVVLSETPEITGSSGDTLSNVISGTWNIGAASFTTTGGFTFNDKIGAGIASGINFFPPNVDFDTIDVSGITIRDVSTSDRSLCFVNIFSDIALASGDEDSTIFLMSVDTNSAGDNVFIINLNEARVADTTWYNYLIIE